MLIMLIWIVFIVSTFAIFTPTAVYAMDVSVLSYGAVGNGTTNDRVAIQNAIDVVSNAGGGTVNLPGGKTYLSGELTLKDNVVLNINSGAILKKSNNAAHYAHTAEYGRWIGGIAWNQYLYKNYPLIYAGSGTHNITVTGSGTVDLNWSGDDSTNIQLCGIGFYRVRNYTISDVTLSNASGYYIALHT